MITIMMHDCLCTIICYVCNLEAHHPEMGHVSLKFTDSLNLDIY